MYDFVCASFSMLHIKMLFLYVSFACLYTIDLYNYGVLRVIRFVCLFNGKALSVSENALYVSYYYYLFSYLIIQFVRTIFT